MNKKFYLIFMLFGITLLSFFSATQGGTKGKIIGKVVNSDDSSPLPGAQVIITSVWFDDIEVEIDSKSGAVADVNGDFFILNLEPGVYSVKATMMGFKELTLTKVEVASDHTSRLEFTMEETTYQGETVVVEAQKKVVKMDLSSSSISVKADELETVPVVEDINDFVNMQAGVSGWSIRGGAQSETQFMMDGLMMVDNRANEPIATPNLSTIQEINILKGGFNAEYGNVRSGIINVVTRKGSKSGYHGSVDIKYTPGYYKHKGPSLFDEDNYYLRPYLDDEVCWEGTENWSEELREQYPGFEGWNSFAEGKEGSPQDYQNVFRWERRLDGAEDLIPGYSDSDREGSYGDKPDMIVDAGFGGPIPLLEDKLTFFASYRMNKDAFALPTYRDYFEDHNGQVKLTYYFKPEIEINFDWMLGKTKTMSKDVRGGSINSYLRSGENIFYSSLADRQEGDRYGGALYLPSALTPYDIDRDMIGLTFSHTLSAKTFYTVRFTRTHIENFSDSSFYDWRSKDIVGHIGPVAVDEAPFGLVYDNLASIDGTMNMGGIQACQRDYSTVTTYNVKGDLTSQINIHNEIKTGFEFNYDDNQTEVGSHELYTKSLGWDDEWEAQPIRLSAYVQDKVEFEGMKANVGLRMDYFNPNTDWYTELYSKYYTVDLKDKLTTEAKKEKADSQIKFSPRFGISHPVTEFAKLYFNYGHFYSLPVTRDLFGIGFGGPIYPVSFLGDPNLDMQKTIAYELGFEQEIARMYSIHVSGYYRDISNETGSVQYIGYDERIKYYTIDNNNYEDVRGFEIQLKKRFGRWFTGWINYDYMIRTWGYTGRKAYYQDRRDQATSGRYELTEDQQDAQPLIRANATLTVPHDYGVYMGGWSFSLLFTWRDGIRFSWDPLKLNTPEVKNNVEWKDYWMLDAQFSKEFKIAETTLEFYGNVNNIMDIEYLDYSSPGFVNGPDFDNYMKSLHLPMYKDSRYPYESGNDQPGDVDKDHINMPNRRFLMYTNPRYVTFGIRYKF